MRDCLPPSTEQLLAEKELANFLNYVNIPTLLQIMGGGGGSCFVFDINLFMFFFLQVLNIQLEARIPEESDYHGIRTLLQLV